jgi:hypothetical protein
VIIKSRPVDSLTDELKSLVNCVGLMEEAAYQIPKPAIARKAIKATREILRVLFTQPF